MRVMVVVMVASQHERLRYATDDQVVNSKDSMRMIGFRNAGSGNATVTRKRRSKEVPQKCRVQRTRFWETVFTFALPDVPGNPAAY